MSNGYHGKILRVDLSREKTTIVTPDDIFYRRYVGGEGFVAYYLLKELPPNIDPLSPENLLIFAAGPLTGTTISGSSRNSVGAKSPLTGGFGESEVGGFWAAELKKAGYDAIIIKGKAKKPLYLWIKDDQIEFRDASKIWGKETADSLDSIRNELADKQVRVSQIGPGGENLVRYACIMSDLRNAAGRTGMGAIMGSKNLKAIAVKGSKRPKVADKAKILALRKKMTEVYLKDLEHFSLLGTGGDRMEAFTWTGNLPVHNFRDGDFPGAEKIDPRNIKNTLGMKMEGCYACPIRCKKVVGFKEPWEVLPKYGGPEYESLGALGSNCGVDDVKAVCKANELCNRYTLDVISTGVTIGFAMECFEEDIITKTETDGIELTFGNGEALVAMVEKIAKREGFGNILAEGVKRAAEEIGNGAEQLAVHVKGQEVPMHSPRLKRALGLGYAVSPTGADHMHNLNDQFLTNEGSIEKFAPIGIMETIPLEDLGPKKVRALMYQTNWRVVYNCLVMCMFQPWNHQEIVEMTRAVTGWNISLFELMKLGERVTTMARVFNLQEGLTIKDDTLPARFYHPKTSGDLAAVAVDPVILNIARENYYLMMGWDKNGIPMDEKLEELDIGWVRYKLR
jgi:aldehyde:ferredoxin oxidoreductase